MWGKDILWAPMYSTWSMMKSRLYLRQNNEFLQHHILSLDATYMLTWAAGATLKPFAPNNYRAQSKV